MNFTLDQFIRFTEPLEGAVTWMYLDNEGLVTTGRGNLIDTPADANKCVWGRPNGLLEEAGEVEDEWRRCKNSGLAGHGGGNQRSVAQLFLAPGELERLTAERLELNEVSLAGHFGAVWPNVHAEAQLAIHSMRWAMGDFIPEWPKFVAAILRGDYLTAAKESRMKGDSVDDSLRRRNNADLTLLLTASQAQPGDSVAMAADIDQSLGAISGGTWHGLREWTGAGQFV